MGRLVCWKNLLFDCPANRYPTKQSISPNIDCPTQSDEAFRRKDFVDHCSKQYGFGYTLLATLSWAA